MPDTNKKKRYTISLSECEMRRLTAYADACGIDRPAALSRLLKQALRDATDISSAQHDDKQQLRLFDTVQIDIFNNTSKVNS